MTHDEKNAVSSEVVNEAGERYNEFHGWVDEEGLHFYAGRVDFVPGSIHGSVRVVIRSGTSNDEALRLLESILGGLRANWPKRERIFGPKSGTMACPFRPPLASLERAKDEAVRDDGGPDP